ncbi:hypothetical protein IEQ34_003320 [Dendrobium chrysotoxum]|uniref:Uncharacterized protein n=1 Tax=Dendrobium chrysotoxum TaxID=161865 RepID=A0AAV7HKA4_DENCH|nr:hypothetical protein IEQ34_003320 [Dendrobium chrysotoxum]
MNVEIIWVEFVTIFQELVCISIIPTINTRSFYWIRVRRKDRLKDELRHPFVPVRIQEFLELVESARLIENDLAMLLFR